MLSIAQIESVVSPVSLQTLANLLAKRSALARSLPEDPASGDSASFARLDAQANEQLEANATSLAAHPSSV